MLVKKLMKVLSNLMGNGSKIKYTEVAVQRDNNNLNIKEYVDGVIESGSNANGKYIKYIDGTMICYGKATKSVSASTQWGGIYATSNQSGLTYPQTFTEAPTCQMGIACTNANGILMMISAGTDSATPDFNFIRGTSGNVNGIVYYTAIGRWK